MRVRLFSGLLAAVLGLAAGCQSGPRPAPAGTPAPSALRAEWESSARVLEQAQAEHAQAERELAQLQRSIYQTALALKRMKEQADLWDRALVTNRAALLIVEDRMRDLQRRAEAPAPVTPPTTPPPGTPEKSGRKHGGRPHRLRIQAGGRRQSIPARR